MILMYHKIYLEAKTMWWVDCDTFYQQMASLAGKKVVYLDDYDEKNLNQVVITFDGVYKNILQFALPILKHFGYAFELFVTGDYIGSDNSFDKGEPHAIFTNQEELSALVDGGGRLQWHSRTHTNLLHTQDHAKIQYELEVPEDIKALDTSGFRWFAYPHGDFNEEVIKLVTSSFSGAVSCIQGNDTDRYRYNRITITNNTKLSNRKVSIIIPAHNYGCFISDAIESVLRQTVVPDEVIIADDASDDNTAEIAEFYVSKNPQLIKYIRNQQNLGPVKNFNRAVSIATGDLICLLGADNRFLSNYIERCAKTLDENKNIGVAYTDYALFGKRASVIYEKHADKLKAGVKEGFHLIMFPEFNTISLESLLARNIMNGSSMFRRKAFIAVGGYRSENMMPEDHDLFYRIVSSGWEAKKVQGTWLEYRQHSDEQLNEITTIQHQLRFYKRKTKELENRLYLYENVLFFKKIMRIIDLAKKLARMLLRITNKTIRHFLCFFKRTK